MVCFCGTVLMMSHIHSSSATGLCCAARNCKLNCCKILRSSIGLALISMKSEAGLYKWATMTWPYPFHASLTGTFAYGDGCFPAPMRNHVRSRAGNLRPEDLPLLQLFAPIFFVFGAIHILGPSLPLSRTWARVSVFAAVWLIVARYLY